MEDISASLTTDSHTSNNTQSTSTDTQSTSDTSINTNDLLIARARTMGVIPPAIVRSNPYNDLTPFCSHLWETEMEMCKNVFDDEIPRPQPGGLTTTKQEDDAYVERFFDGDTILINGYRFLKMALIAISQYNHTQIVNSAHEYFDNDKRNQELFEDAGTSQQMRTTTDITSFFDKKFIDDHNHQRFLVRVMQYIQSNFDHFKQTYGMAPLPEATTAGVTTTPAGSPGRSESTERARSADDGRMTPISEADIDFPASLEVPKSRNSQTPVLSVRARGHDQAAPSTHVEPAARNDENEPPSSRQRHASERRSNGRGEPLKGNQQDSHVPDDERKGPHGVNSFSSRADSESTTPSRRHGSTSSRELSAQRIKEFVPSQSRGHSSGQMSGRGHHTTAPRYEQTGYHATSPAYNVSIHPAEYVAYSNNQPQRNDQPRQNNRGRGGYSGRGRGRGQGSGNIHVLDHNKYQRLPAEAFQYPQNQPPFPPTAAERSENWRQKENGPPNMDTRRALSDQTLSAPFGFGSDPIQQHMPFLPPGSGPMRHAFTNQTNNSGGFPRQPYGHNLPPFPENRSVSDGSSLEGRMESHVTISNIPDDVSADLVVARVAGVLDIPFGQCQIRSRTQGSLVVEIGSQAAWSLVLQQPRIVIQGRRLQFERPPRPAPEFREGVKRRYPNRDRTRHNTEQSSGDTGDMPPMAPFGPVHRNASFGPGFPFNSGLDQHQPGPYCGRPPVPDVYQPNVAFAGAERGWGFEEPFAGQHVGRPDRSRGPSSQEVPKQNAGPSGKKNKKSPKKNAQRSGSYHDTTRPEQAETIIPEDSVSLAGAPDFFSQSRDNVEASPTEVNIETSAGPAGHKKVTSTSSIETVKQEVSAEEILIQLSSQSAPINEGLNSPPPQSSATREIWPTGDKSPVIETRLPDETIAEELLAGSQAAVGEDTRRDTVHEALAEPKIQSSNFAEGLAVQGTPKRNLTPREPGEDVDESFQTAHESPIEDKDDEPLPTTVEHEAATAEPSELSESKDVKPEKEQEMVAGTQAQHGIPQNKDKQQRQTEQRNVSSKTVNKGDKPQELAPPRPAKTESLSPFARQSKSKKMDKKPKPAKGKGKEEVPADTQAQSQAMPATKQTQTGSTGASQETTSSAAKDKTTRTHEAIKVDNKITRSDEAIKVDDKPTQEQVQHPSNYINESVRTSAGILLEAIGIDCSVSKRSAAHDATSTKFHSDDGMPSKGKGKGSMHSDQTAASTTQITNDTMFPYEGKGKGKMDFDPASTILTQEPKLPVSTVPDLEDTIENLDLTKEGDATGSISEVPQRSVSQLSNVTESTQSVPGEKPKSKKKKKNKKKKAAPTDATTATERSVEPANGTESKAITNEDDSEEGDKIFTPPGSSVADSPESKQGKTSRIASSSLLQAPRNTLQMRKQKQPAKPRKVSDAATENEADSPKAGESSNILSELRQKLPANVEFINLSTSKAPANFKPASPSQLDNPVNESVKKMLELKHRETITKISRESNEEAREKALRLENKRYEEECSKRERDNLCNTDDSQATIGATDTAASSETVDYPETSAAENNDNDRGLTQAQAKFERDQEQERLRQEEFDRAIGSYYSGKNTAVGGQLQRDIHTAIGNPDPKYMDSHTPGYRGPVPVPTLPKNPLPDIMVRMAKVAEVFGQSHEYEGETPSWANL